MVDPRSPNKSAKPGGNPAWRFFLPNISTNPGGNPNMSPDEIVPAVVIEVPDEQTQAVVPVASEIRANPDGNVAVLDPVDIPPPVVLEVPDPAVVIAPKGVTAPAIVVSDVEEKIGVSSEVDGTEFKSVASKSRANPDGIVAVSDPIFAP